MNERSISSRTVATETRVQKYRLTDRRPSEGKTNRKLAPVVNETIIFNIGYNKDIEKADRHTEGQTDWQKTNTRDDERNHTDIATHRYTHHNSIALILHHYINTFVTIYDLTFCFRYFVNENSAQRRRKHCTLAVARQTHKQTHIHTGAITIHCAAYRAV